MAETNLNGEAQEAKKEITLKFGKGLVGKEFQFKSAFGGIDYTELRIPNADQNDKRPWQTFAIKTDHLHESPDGKSVWINLPAEGRTALKRSVVIGEKPDGTREWRTEKNVVTNAELEKMVEAYKERAREAALEAKQAAYEAAVNEVMADPNLSEVAKAEQLINLTEDYGKAHFTMEQKNDICDHAYQTEDVAGTLAMIQTMSEQMRAQEKQQNREITLKFGKGLVGEEFQGKDGTSYREIKIPNVDQNDKRSWQSFVVKANHVHENQYGSGNGMWLKLPAEGHTTLKRSVVIGEKPDGTKEWGTEKNVVTNAELKKLVEAYKERPRESVTEKLAEKKAEAASQAAVSEPREKERSRENALG
ncbi:MAG: hypothetical protein NC409_04105 [Clostridium sp.]|nr:hypothetical protein [Clostridium sp.]